MRILVLNSAVVIDWEDAFLATCAVLGEPFDALANASARPLAAALEDRDKTKRAKALAGALASVALAVEHVELGEIA